MPRRKEIKINPLELECSGDIIRELQADSRFENCDFSTLSLSVKEKKAPAKIMDVDKAINNLKNFMAVKGNSIEVVGGKQVIRKHELTKRSLMPKILFNNSASIYKNLELIFQDFTS